MTRFSFSFSVGGEHAFYSLATQMNLLVDTPEKVWSSLDRHQYLTAAQLYLLSQHIVEHSLNINTGMSCLFTVKKVSSRIKFHFILSELGRKPNFFFNLFSWEIEKKWNTDG